MSSTSESPLIHTVIVTKLGDEKVNAVLGVIQDWSAVELVDRSIWVDADSDMEQAWVVDDGRISLISLVPWLARNAAKIRLITLQVLADTADSLTVSILERVGQKLPLNRGIAALNLLAPGHGVTGISSAALFESRFNIVLQPVDGTAPGEHNTEPVRTGSANFPMHVAVGLATASGLWRAMAKAPLDDDDPWTGTRVAASRSYLRMVDTSDILAQLSAKVFGADPDLPVSRQVNGEPSPLVPPGAQLSAVRAAAESVAAKHQKLTKYHAPPPFSPPARVRVGFRQAWAMFFSFLAKALLSAPKRWVEQLVEATRRKVATTTTKIVFGTESKFEVVLGGVGAADSRSTDDLEHAARTVLQKVSPGGQQPPTPAPELWQDLLAASAAMVDGGDPPEGIVLPTSDTAAPVINNSDKIAPDPDTPPLRIPKSVLGTATDIYVEATDPYQALQVLYALRAKEELLGAASEQDAQRLMAVQLAVAELNGWVAQQQSYSWTFGMHAAQELDAAGRDLTKMLRSGDVGNAQELADPIKQQSKVRRGVLTWLGAFILVLVAAIVIGVRTDIAWPLLVSVTAVLLAAILFGAVKTFANNQRVLFGVLNRLEIEALRSRWNAANLAAISEEVVRLTSMYQQTRAWLTAIAHHVHDPFGGTDARSVEPDPSSYLRGDLPLSMKLAAARFSMDKHEAIVFRARGRLLSPGWLSRHYQHRRDQILQDIRRRTDRDLEGRLWTDAAMDEGGPLKSYLAGLRNDDLREQSRLVMVNALVDAVIDPAVENRLLPELEVRAGGVLGRSSWSALAAELTEPAIQVPNSGFSVTGGTDQAYQISRSFVAALDKQVVPEQFSRIPLRPFADGSQLDRVLVRWDLARAVAPDNFSYFADSADDRLGTPTPGGIDVEY